MGHLSLEPDLDLHAGECQPRALRAVNKGAVRSARGRPTCRVLCARSINVPLASLAVTNAPCALRMVNHNKFSRLRKRELMGAAAGAA